MQPTCLTKVTPGYSFGSADLLKGYPSTHCCYVLAQLGLGFSVMSATIVCVGVSLAPCSTRSSRMIVVEYFSTNKGTPIRASCVDTITTAEQALP